ncbi:hypothetical protein [Streptomyces sp. NP160]|uniref:hypothetical protein n=1 Tax=Streptomyces sp. NP160 TaxID=2586637 RepID=UPI001C570A10|nr:hypothetical protein [Streptomyces sp. NP160]
MAGVSGEAPVAGHGTRRELRASRAAPGGPGRRRTALLALLAVLLLGAGGLLATVARPVESVSAALPLAPATPLVVLSPQLLASRDGQVVVTARGDGPVLLARGGAGDVAAWARGTTSSSATGLDDDGGVRVERADGAASAPDPAGSDLWTAQQRGEGRAQLRLGPSSALGAGAQAVLVASDGASPAPARVEVTWSSRPVPPPAWVVLGAGAACAAVAAVGARRGAGTPA